MYVCVCVFSLPSTRDVRRVTLAALRRPAGRLRPIFSRRSLRQRPPFFDFALRGDKERAVFRSWSVCVCVCLCACLSLWVLLWCVPVSLYCVYGRVCVYAFVYCVRLCKWMWSWNLPTVCSLSTLLVSCVFQIFFFAFHPLVIALLSFACSWPFLYS